MPLNWQQWNSQDGYAQFAVTNKNNSPNNPALSGSQSFSVTSTGGSGDISRAWLNEAMPADVQISAAVDLNTAIPAQVIARGSNLDTPDGSGPGLLPSFYAVQISTASPGPKLELVKDVNGTLTSLGSINAPQWISGQWLEETLDVEGSTVRAQLFDPTTGEYLNSSGQWQSSQVWALTVIDNSISGPGVIGVGRATGSIGTVTFDDFSVQAPATDQSFDATPMGQVPDNWTTYSTNSNDSVAVSTPASPVPPNSGPNVLAITAVGSGDQARAWLNTSLPGDLSVSAYAYIEATPAQVFARGSNLETSSPTYYAVEVSEGGVVQLVKVVNGTQAVLGNSVTSTLYIDNIWVQETLGLSRTTVEAQIYRPDTQQYLTSSGGWQSTPTWALTATDTSIPETGGGQAGVGRPTGPPEYVGTNYFDDFTAATGMDAQNFDASTSLSSSVWNQSSTNQFSVVAAPTGISPMSSPNVLESTAGSVASQIWDTNESLTNAQVSVGMYLSGTAVQVFARGTGLKTSGTSTPSYYGLSVTTGEYGPTVALERVNAGVVTQPPQWVLTPLPSYPTPYLSGVWVQVTLYVDGANLRAQVYRPDTGEYLNSEDQWQVDPTYALNVTDSDPLTGAGYAGLARGSGSGPVLYFDNFAVAPLSVDSTPPSVTVSAPGGTQTGTVTITATPSEPVPNESIAKVEFYVDDNNPVLNYVATAAPYTWTLDTSSLSNTTHRLLVLAYDNEGNVSSAATTNITTSNNTTLTMPSNFPPYPNSSVGITELSYAQNIYDSQLLQNYVDVVVNDEDGTDAATMQSLAPNVQQLLYSNLSNIYDSSAGDLLTSWLNYAEKNGIDPEQAFYHVAIATPYSGGSPNSTHPVDQFWGIYVGGSTLTDWTWRGYGASGPDIPFGDGTVGQSIYIGYPDQFWEMNFDLTSGASGGWSGVLEYPTAVDSSGNPTAWATLSTLSDTTAGFTQTGQSQITFNPPSNWVPASINGSPLMYYVRVRTVTAGTAPQANFIKGDNYTNSPADSNGTSGVIPAYDWALDPNGIGYLNPQEYAIAAAAGYTARFAYQSRLFYAGPMRFYTNPSNPQFKAWAIGYYPSLVTGPYNGLFFDNSGAPPPQENPLNIEKYNLTATSGIPIALVEQTGSYSTDYATLLNEIGQKLPPNGWIMANIGNWLPLTGEPGQSSADPVVSKVQSYYSEGNLLASSEDTTEFLLDMYDGVYYRANNDHPSYAVIDSKSNGTPQDPQTQLTTLAAYYLLAPNNPSQGALDFFGGEDPESQWVQSWSLSQFNHWSQAATYNVGVPESPLVDPSKIEKSGYYFQTGMESDNSTYYVFDREFTRQNSQPVLVLYKPVSVLPNGGASQLTGSASASTVPLGGSYYVLQADGTLSSTAVTSISLDNGEGVILVQAGTDAPTLAGATMVAASSLTSPAAAPASTPPPSGASAVSQGSTGPTTSDLLAVAGQVPMGPLADQSDLAADLDYFLSLWTMAKMGAAASAGSNGPSSIWPGEGGQAPMTAPVPLAGSWSWLGSTGLLKAHSNSSPFEDSPWAVHDAVVASSSASPADDPLAPSSAI